MSALEGRASFAEGLDEFIALVRRYLNGDTAFVPPDLTSKRFLEL